MLGRIISFLIHLGPLKGWKVLLGAVLSQLILAGVIPPPWVPIAEFVAAWLTGHGILSKAADKSGAIPARRKAAWEVN